MSKRAWVLALSIIALVIIVAIAPSPSFLGEALGEEDDGLPRIYLMAALSGNGIRITWSDVPKGGEHGAYALELRRMAEGGFNSELIAEPYIDSRTYHDMDVQPGIVYHYWLYVLSYADDAEHGNWMSNEIHLSLDAVPPSLPLNFTASAGSSEANLSWDEPASDGGGSVYNYTIYSGSNPADLFPLLNVSDHDHYWHGGCTIRNLTNGQEYYFAVQAINPVGASNLTDALMVKPMPAPALTLTSEEVSDGEFDISVTWVPPAAGEWSAVSYILYVDGIASTTQAFEYPAGEGNWSHHISAFGDYLSFRVAAVYEDGNTSYSNRESIGFGMYEGIALPFYYYLAILALPIAAVLLVILFQVRRRKVR